MTDETTTDEETAPAQTVLELPHYHGTPASGMKTSLTGVGKRITRSHEIDEKIVLLVEARVKSAGHESTDDGLLYVEKLATIDLFEVIGEPGRRLLAQMRTAYRAGDDAAAGRKALELGSIDLTEAGVELTTDASGVVLTSEEIAEIRKNDPLAAAEHPQLRPAVIVFSDGSRDLWPDDYEENDPRPVIGQRYEDDAPDSLTGYVYVKQLLHAETGETLEEWTEEQENARLEALETELAAKEATAEAELAATPDAGEVPSEAPDDEVEFVVDDDGFAEPLDPERAAELSSALGSNVTALRPDTAGPGEDPAEAEDALVADILPADYAFVDRTGDELLPAIAASSSEADLRRYIAAEEDGRGRGLKPRKTILAAMTKRLEELFLEGTPTSPDLPAGDLEVPADADVDGGED